MLWNRWPLRPLWLAFWRRRLLATETVISITGWRSAIIGNGYGTQRVTFC